MESMEGMEGMEGMESMEGMEGMAGMESMEGMEGTAGMVGRKLECRRHALTSLAILGIGCERVYRPELTRAGGVTSRKRSNSTPSLARSSSCSMITLSFTACATRSSCARSFPCACAEFW